jgi:hypothetical protein
VSKFLKSIIVLSVAGAILAGGPASAGPIDFLKRIGDSIAHAHDRQEARDRGHKRKSDRDTERTKDQQEQPAGSTAPAAAPQTASVSTQPSPSASPPVRAAAGVPESTQRDIPYGIPVPGKDGLVMSPWSPNQGYVDVRGFASGTQVKDPYTGKVFLTP